MKKNLLLTVLILLLFSFNARSQQYQIDSSEINWSVPELVKFHDVIYLIWHEAYPSKNITQLKGFVGDIKSAMEGINSAKLPGIVREKEMKWKEGLAEFNKSAQDYYNSAEGTDDQAMLNSAEILHSKFEMMVRILKPVLKEVDEYHKILYVIYHKYTPDKKYNDINNVIDDLISKAEALVNYPADKLEKKLGAKSEDCKLRAKSLYTATVSLKEALKTQNPASIDAAIENMHSKYQNLEKIFD